MTPRDRAFEVLVGRIIDDAAGTRISRLYPRVVPAVLDILDLLEVGSKTPATPTPGHEASVFQAKLIDAVASAYPERVARRRAVRIGMTEALTCWNTVRAPEDLAFSSPAIFGRWLRTNIQAGRLRGISLAPRASSGNGLLIAANAFTRVSMR